MEKCVINIKLSNEPAFREGKWENEAYGWKIYHRVDGFIIVDSVLLLEVLNDKSNLVEIDETIQFLFKPEHPIAAN